MKRSRRIELTAFRRRTMIIFPENPGRSSAGPCTPDENRKKSLAWRLRSVAAILKPTLNQKEK
jgi:hypothetical protein